MAGPSRGTSRAAPRVRALAAATALAALLAGCATDSTSDATAAAVGRPAPTGPPTRAPLPDPCAVVDATDLGLYLALDEWRQAGGAVEGRRTCQYRGRTWTVTTVALADSGALPDGLCAPPGSQPLGSRPPVTCRYAGPGMGSVTTVVARDGVALGVRVEGPDARRYADVLAEHARSHL